MEHETPFGAVWRSASLTEVLLALFIIIVILLVFILVSFYLRSTKDVSHEYQYILFKAKSKGLTNFQYKILRGMTEMLKLSHPSDIVSKPELYERSIGNFINFLTSKEEEQTSLLRIFKDIVITYEKIYKDIRHRKPLESISQFTTGHLLYFYTDDQNYYLGKITSITGKQIGIILFRKPGQLRFFPYEKPIHCFFWRPGDAEYFFNSQIEETSKNMIFITRPSSIERGQEVRLPYINVIEPCKLSYHKNADLIEINLTIYKLGENELIIRSNKELAYSNEYHIEFRLFDFTVNTSAIMISDKTVSDKGIYYFTFKMTSLSEPAHNVLRSYIYEHL
jgi:hypothetical protein